LDVVDDLYGISFVGFAQRQELSITHARLQINENGPGDVTRVIALVVKDILAVAALGCEVFQIPVLTDPMFLTQLLPELAPNYIPSANRQRSRRAPETRLTAVAALTGLDRDDFSERR